MYSRPDNDTTGKLAAPPQLERLWLLLGVTALALAGLFSLVLVVGRTPSTSSIQLISDLFHKALVVHVDLSVLVWFLTISSMIWSMEARKCRTWVHFPLLEEAALAAMAAGSLLLALSPLAGGEALMSNYIPVIANPVFFLGLALILCSVGLMLLHVFLHRPPGESVVGFAAYTAALTALIGLFSYLWAWQRMPAVIEGQQYFDMLFWAGGHVFQFVNTQMTMIAWLALIAALIPAFRLPRGLLLALFSIAPLTAIFTPLVFVSYGVASQEFRLFFTHRMMDANGIGPAILGVAIIAALLKAGCPAPAQKALHSTLIMSLLLFIYGGVIGLAIHGEDVTIPAHYHGSIVGVTLAFMGLAYLWLPRFGDREVAGSRLAFWQPIVYGSGQIMHISGLAWSGGYGVLRKTPGALEGGFTAAKAAMGLMGMGGLLAIIGGFMFVVVVARSVYSSSSRLPSAK